MGHGRGRRERKGDGRVITEFMIDLTTGIIAGFIPLLPPVTFDSAGFTATTTAFSRMGALNGYFPVATLGLCLGLVFGLKLWMLAYRLVLFIYHQFWGSD